MIRSNLEEVMKKHKPELSVRRLAKDINHSFDTVRNMKNGTMKQYSGDLLNKLCTYFDCEVGDLIKFEKD